MQTLALEKEPKLHGYIVPFISLVASVVTIIAFIHEYKGTNKTTKIYVYLALMILLIATTAYSVTDITYLRNQNLILKNNAEIAKVRISLVNRIMSEIERFNNLQSLPEDSHEAIEDFQYNIRTAAEELRKLEGDVNNINK